MGGAAYARRAQALKAVLLTLVVLAVLFPMWSVLVTSLASRETINEAGGMVVVRASSTRRPT